MKFMLLLGLIGHIFCGASDCLLTYAPNGKVNLTDFKDYEKSSVSFRGMPLKNLTIAMILGVGFLQMHHLHDVYWISRDARVRSCIFDCCSNRQDGHAKMGMDLQSASVSCRYIADEASCQGKCNRRRYVPRTLVFDVISC